jgi:hypothetical protein
LFGVYLRNVRGGSNRKKVGTPSQASRSKFKNIFWQMIRRQAIIKRTNDGEKFEFQREVVPRLQDGSSEAS